MHEKEVNEISMKKLMFRASVLVFGVVLSLTGCRSISRLVDSGGTVLVVEVVTTGPNRAELTDRAIKVIQARISAVGLDGEVTRSASGDDSIEVKVYGAPDLEVLRKFLFITHRLEMKSVVSPPSPAPVRIFASVEQAEASAGDEVQVLPYAEREDSAVKQFVILRKGSIITGEHIRSARAVSRSGSDFDYQITFTLNQDGAARFGDWTGKNINNYLAVVLDDKVQSIAYIRSQISDMGEISGRFTKDSAEEIALSLNSGYIDATFKVIEERPFK